MMVFAHELSRTKRNVVARTPQADEAIPKIQINYPLLIYK
jgi:hypothetical protein